MKLRISTPALVRRPHGACQWIVRRFAAVASLVLFTASTPAYADRGAYEGYEEYYNYNPPQRYVVPAPAYTYDPVNRRSSLTPEPVWRSMFPSARERARVEEYTIGVPGHSAQEMRYWERQSRRHRR